MQPLELELDGLVERTGFSGVVSVEHPDRSTMLESTLLKAYGDADRAYAVRNTVEMQFGIASGAKTFTALTVMCLVERGLLSLDTTARSLLGKDLPLIGDDVTVEHLLAHRSGIGDYLDEAAMTDVNDYVMTVPVHELATTEQYVRVLEGHEAVSPPGERFAYNNAGDVVLALLAERASGVPFHELVRTCVCEPAGMVDTHFLRSDELPAGAARGYLDRDGLRTNVLHLPVRGSGDGGIYSTAADLSAFWTSLHEGRIVSPALVAEMMRPHSDWPEESRRYGLGFHLRSTRGGAWLEGSDAGVSFVSMHGPSGLTYTVISNWSSGAWPVVDLLEERLGPSR